MDVSIIIVNYNTRDMLRDCLGAIREKCPETSHETIVVDNASTDGSADMVASSFPEVQLIRSKENLGFGRANNLGAKEAKGKYLFFLNSDTIMINDALCELRTFMDANPKCGIAGGNLTDLEGRPIHSHSMALPGPCTDLVRLIPGQHRTLHGKNWTYNYTGAPLRVTYVTGADMMMRRELFEALGGFDPDFFMYYEETELTWRASLLGYTVWSVPSARITHIKGGSLEGLQSVKRMVYESKYLYMRKVYGPWAPGLTRFSFALYCGIKILGLTLLGRLGRIATYKGMLASDKEAYSLTEKGRHRA
jgi:GT2 family glycosyltransferase